MNVQYTYGKNTRSKLTVTATREVRIKLAKGLTKEDVEVICDRLLNVAREILESEVTSTLRGTVGDKGITMYNDSRKHSYKYTWKTNND